MAECSAVNRVIQVRLLTSVPMRGCSSSVERRSPKPRQSGFNSCLPRHLHITFYWNATSARLLSFRECSRSRSCAFSFSSALRPISRCCPTLWLPRTQIRAYRWCSPPRIGCAIMSPNRSIGRVQGASLPSERCVRTHPHLASVLLQGRKSANIHASSGGIRGIPVGCPTRDSDWPSRQKLLRSRLRC
jgi:hypothetical protein